MSIESMFKKRFGNKIKKVPDRLKPTAESMKKMNKQLSFEFDRNEAMRQNSYYEAERSRCE